jgi:hypothetical protein
MIINELPKKGDEITLMRSSSGTGAQSIEGQLLKVLSVFGRSGTSPSIQVQVVEEPGLSTWTIYPYRDEWVFATKEKKIEYLTKQISNLEKQLQEAKDELNFITKYESEEEWIDDQIQEILKTGTAKNQRIEILKLLSKRLRK